MKHLLALLLFAFSGFAADKLETLGPVQEGAPEIIKKLWKHPEALKSYNAAPEFFNAVMGNLWDLALAEEKAKNKPLKKSAYRWEGNFTPKEEIHNIPPKAVAAMRGLIVDRYTKNYVTLNPGGKVALPQGITHFLKGRRI